MILAENLRLIFLSILIHFLIKKKTNRLKEYVNSKNKCLKILKSIRSNSKLINMKIFHMYGKEDSKNKFVPSIVNKIKNDHPEINLTSGEQTRDFIYVDDVVEAFRIILANFKKLQFFEDIQVGTGSETRVKDFVKN